MKKNEVKVGQTYRCKVSGSLVDVRITGENAHGGWDGKNLVTGKAVRIKSPQRLRSVVQRPAKRKKIVTLAEYEAGIEREQASAERAAGQVRKDIAKTVEAVRNGDLAKGVTVPTGKKRSEKKKAEKSDGEKRPSGLDAAAQVLADAGEPLNCKEMVERMLAKGLWQTKGRTPAATIYAAVIREIAAKGAESRFRKVERGKFELTK